MKCLFFLALLAMWVGGNGTETYNIKYPQLKAKIYEPEVGKTAFEFTWNPVKSWDEKYPIIGYKVVVWEMKLQKIKVENYDNEEPMFVEREDVLLSPRIVGEPTIVTVSPDERKVVYDKVKNGAWYEHTALAFTKKEEGPLAPIVAIKVHE